MSTAIVWLTSFDDSEADEAFARLAFEARPWGTVIGVRHRSGVEPQPMSEGMLSFGDEELAATLPGRFREMSVTRAGIATGFLDVLLIAVMQRLPEFDHVWFVEYDVDFSGHWAAFFACFAGCDADLLGAAIYPRSQADPWTHWRTFSGPADLPAKARARGLFPVNRMSRRFVNLYARTVEEGWKGHFEALMPTIAFHHGLKVEDIGGEGPLTPVTRRGLFYIGSADPALTAGTFRFRPPVAPFYHHRLPLLPANHLWHPVKTKAYFAQQAR